MGGIGSGRQPGGYKPQGRRSQVALGDPALLPLIDPELLDNLSEDELDELVEMLAATHDKRVKIKWKLSEQQQSYEDASTLSFETLAGGMGNTQKTNWMLWHLYDHANRFSGFRGRLLRRSFPELRRTAILESLKFFDSDFATYYTGTNTWRFHNGSQIEFGYLERDLDAYRYQGSESHCNAFDELTQFPNDFCYRFLMGWVRSPNEGRHLDLRPHVIAGTNPGGLGGEWVKKRFVDIGDPGKIHVVPDDPDDEIDPEFPPTRVFISGGIGRNPHISPAEYRRSLRALPSKVRAAIELGDWDTVEGAYFSEFDKKIHVVPPFAIPDDWPRTRALDWGYAHPMCCLWGAVSPTGQLVVYREMHGSGMTAPVQARKINEMSAGERIRLTVADPSIWSQTGIGDSVANQYAKSGLHCIKANNVRKPGWSKLRSLLEVNETGTPGIVIFENCVNLIRSLPMQVHSSVDPEDMMKKDGDDPADCIRYLALAPMVRPSAPPAPRTPAMLAAHRLNQVADDWSSIDLR